MANDCLPQIHACRLRVTKLDATGAPAPGASNAYVTDALASLEFGWETETGEEITEKNACGEIIVNYKAPDSIKRGTVTINLLTPDPELEEVLTAGALLTEGAAVGFAAPPIGAMSEELVSVELWTKRINAGVLDGTFPYARWVYPKVTKLRPGNHTHAQANLGRSFVGEAHENENWGNGGFNDWLAASDRVYQWLPVADTDLPEVSCGYVTVPADVP